MQLGGADEGKIQRIKKEHDVFSFKASQLEVIHHISIYHGFGAEIRRFFTYENGHIDVSGLKVAVGKSRSTIRDH